MSGSADGGARGGPTERDLRAEQIEALGQNAIKHHLACSRSGALDFVLVESGVSYLCRECGARVTVAPDDERAMTAHATAKVPELIEIARRQARPSKRRTAELGGISRSTLDEWIARRWMPWPPR